MEYNATALRRLELFFLPGQTTDEIRARSFLSWRIRFPGSSRYVYTDYFVVGSFPFGFVALDFSKFETFGVLLFESGCTTIRSEMKTLN